LRHSAQVKPGHLNKNPKMGQHWSILTFDVSTIQELFIKEISSMDIPQYGQAFFYDFNAANWVE
jgi:hypothetical protein